MLGIYWRLARILRNCLMFTISTHDSNIKTCWSGHHLLLRLPEPVFCSFHWFGLAIIISISKMLVKKSTDLKLNLPLSRHLLFLRCSFSCGIGQLIFVASPLFFISFITFFFFFIGRWLGTFFKWWIFNAFNALNAFCPIFSTSSITFFFFFIRWRSGTFFADECSTCSTRFGAFLGIVFSESWWK